MAEPASAAEKLRAYLEGLSPKARAAVVAQLERDMLRGETGLELVLRELRTSLRADQRAEEPRPRLPEYQRLFYEPLEPFLIDSQPAEKSVGRVPRSCLDPIWTWLARDFVPADVTAFVEAVTAALVTDDVAGAGRLAKSFQDHIVARIKDALTEAQRDEVVARKLAARLGSRREVEELRDVAAILRSRDALALIGSRFPVHIKNLSDESLDNARQVLATPVGRHPEVFRHALVVLMGRLAHPWQIIRVAIRSVDSDLVAKIAETPHVAAIDLAFFELDRRVAQIDTALRPRNIDRLSAAVKDVHDFARGFRTELDFSGDSVWSRKLAATRKHVAGLLSSEVEAASGDLRRLLKPRGRKDAATSLPLTADDIALAESALELLLLCRIHAGEIALNELTQRATAELNTQLESGTMALIEALRTATDAEKPFRLSQLDAAVRLAGRVFGTNFAQLLTKAIDLAAQGRPAEGTVAAR